MSPLSDKSVRELTDRYEDLAMQRARAIMRYDDSLDGSVQKRHAIADMNAIGDEIQRVETALSVAVAREYPE